MTKAAPEFFQRIKTKSLVTAISSLTALGSVTVPNLASAQVLEEVIVSAQRREQSILDVPVAVSAFSAESLKAAAVDDISDLNAANPSFMATPFLSDPLGNAPIRIRGIGTGGGNPGFEGAVGLYVDDVYRSRTGSAMLTFFDMDGVEILRGPQGTLFGKNTTAGALIQRTAAPVIDENSASITAEAGNYGQQMVSGYANVAVGDSLAFRVSAIRDDQDGWFQHAVTGEDTFWMENEAYRASVVFEPTLEFSGRLTLDHSSMRSPGNYGTSTRLNTEDESGLVGRQEFFRQLALDPNTGDGSWFWDVDQAGNIVGFDAYSRDIRNNPAGGDYKLEQTGLTAHLSWDISDSIQIRSITGWRDIDSASVRGDWDFGPTNIAGDLNQLYEFDTFSQEFLVSGDMEFGGEMTMDFVAGFNYFTEDAKYDRQASVGEQFPDWIVYLGALGDAVAAGGNPNDVFIPAGTARALEGLGVVPNFGNAGTFFQDVSFDQTEDSYGLFGHTTLNFTDMFSLIVGARWNRIEKEIDTSNNISDDQNVYHDFAAQNILGLYVAGRALMSPSWEDELTNEEWTYNLTGQIRPNDDLQIYLSYSRGFKAGGFNMNEDAVGGTPNANGTPDANGRVFSAFTPETASFAPEFVDAYELGIRQQIGDSGRISLTLFRSDYDDLQVATFTGFNFEVVNAGTSDTRGLEIETEWAVTEQLRLTGGATFMKAEYGNDVVGLPAGRRRGQTPDESVVIGARYYQPLSGDMEAYVNANYTYQGEMFLAEGSPDTPLSRVKQDAYTIASATVGIRVTDDWDVNLSCNNCFDEDYYEWAFNQPFHNALMANPAPPMTWAVSATKQF